MKDKVMHKHLSKRTLIQQLRSTLHLGVPQGPVLATLLFIMHTGELDQMSVLKCIDDVI